MKAIITGAAMAALTITAGAAFAHGVGGGMSSMHAMSAAAAAKTTAPASPTTTTTTTPTTTQQPAAKAQAHAYGQPNASCGSVTAPNTPGNAASAPGSAFNENGVAGTQYAGQQPQNSINPAAVSQYDAACANQPH